MKVDKEELRKSIEKNMLEFVAIKTDSGSKFECDVRPFFTKWFEDVTYLKENKKNCGLFPIPNDHLDRAVPWALLKGKGNDTVVLIHHLDTVETKDYQTLQPLALKPYEVTEAFKQGKMELPPHVKADLDTGDWLFGRGVADMKGGGAMYMSLFEEYSKNPDFNGNIVLLSLPDEESYSAGMIGAVYLLDELQKEHGLEYVLTIDSESHEREDVDKPIMFDGSIGKMLPVVYVRGKLAHGGMIYKGINSINIMAEIIRRTDFNADFTEKLGNTVSPPPAWMYHKDRKSVYDVSLPIATTAYMNILPLTRSPKEIMEMLKDISVEAFDEVIVDMNKSYATYCDKNGFKVQELEWKTNVKYYSEIYAEAVRDSGEAFEQAIKATNAEIKDKFFKNELMVVDAANMIIEKTLEYVKDLSPVVVLSMAPPYYPSVSNTMIGEKAAKVDKVFKDALAFTKETMGDECVVKSIYTGISDLSYAMFAFEDDVIDYINNNMLLWEDIYYIPLDIIKRLSTPILNIGPWGKDIHKYTERVYTTDLYYKTPYITDYVISNMLGN